MITNEAFGIHAQVHCEVTYGIHKALNCIYSSERTRRFACDNAKAVIFITFSILLKTGSLGNAIREFSLA